MLTVVFKNFFRFLALILIQVLLVKNFELGRFINPFPYVLFILWLPFEISSPLLLAISFLTGLSVDLFYSTPGLHASAAVLLAFLRPKIYGLFSPREGYDVGAEPSIASMGFNWMLACYGSLIFIHHLVVFLLEAYRFNEMLSILLRSILSTALSLFICILAQYMVLNKKATNQ